MDIEEKETRKKYKQKKLRYFLLMFFAIALIGVGVYVNSISSPKYIASFAIDAIKTNTDKYLNRNEDLNLGDDYSATSKVKFNMTSDAIKQMSASDGTTPAVPYDKILNNLNNTDNTIQFNQDYTNKKLLATLSTKLNNEEIINAKYLIQNSTGYYFVKDYLTTYVNTGNNNYFESLTESKSTRENINYLYNFITESLKKNLKDDYFTRTNEETDITDGNKKLVKTSFNLTNDIAKELAKNVLSDLKNDEKANKILISMNEDFKTAKIDDNTKILGNEDKFIINIYTDGLLYQTKKYEIIYGSGQDETRLTYEPGKDKGVGYLLQNGKSMYKFETQETVSRNAIEIFNSESNESLGMISLEKTPKRSSVSINFKSGETSVNMNYDNKISEIVKNKSYQSAATVSIKVVNNNLNIINGNIDIQSTFKNEATINEDVTNSVLASSIDQTNGNQQLMNYYSKLMQKMSS